MSGLAPSSGQASARRFAVGFSYAGEDRAVVGPIAERLAERLTRARVLYDKFHDAELARVDLDVYLPALYRDQTDLIVVVLSPDYPKKRWCGLEWRWIRQLILGEARERIMLLQIGSPGDLSALGLLSGDGFLDISHATAEVISGKILERLAFHDLSLALTTTSTTPTPMPAPVLALSPSSGQRLPWLRLPLPLALLVGAGVVFIAGWLVGRPLLAHWQVRQGDEAFLAYAKMEDVDQLRRAESAWRLANTLAPHQPEPHARLGFLADILGDPTAAVAHWTVAAQLVPKDTPEARSIRNGLANALAQQAGQRERALSVYEADRFYPRSAMEAAILRWSEPAKMAQALDAINEPALGNDLVGDGLARNPWGFKSHDALLLFESLAHQRCLLAGVRAVTVHLAASGAAGPHPAFDPAPLASPDCHGVQASVRELLCHRLALARPNPRTSATARWLGCPQTSAGPGASADVENPHPFP